MNKGMLKGIAQELKDKGRYGDTELVHINSEEKALLKALGGAGTINPETGLEEYWGGWKSITKVFQPRTYSKAAKDVAKVVVGGVEKVADDFLGIDDSGGIVGSVSKIGSNIEDVVREGIDEVDKAIQSPEVRFLATIVATAVAGPQAGKLTGDLLDAYATVDSGEDLSATQIANLATNLGTQDFTPESLKLDPEIAKAINTAGAAIDGDPLKVLVNTYGEDIVTDLGFKEAAETGLQNAIGTDAYNLVKDNLDIARVGYDVVVGGKDPSQAIADRYGDRIVGALGSDNPSVNALGYAGLKTAVALDQGKDQDEALLSGAREYYDRGGQLPDFNAIADLTGISDFNVQLPDLGIEIPELEVLGYSIPEIANLGFDISKLGLEGLETRGFSLPEIQGYGVDISNLQFPDLQLRGYGLEDIGELGFDVADMDFSGLKRTDLGDYNLGELKDLGVDLQDLDLNLELGSLAAVLASQRKPGQLPESQEEEIVSLENELLAPEGKPFSRQVLESTFA